MKVIRTLINKLFPKTLHEIEECIRRDVTSTVTQERSQNQRQHKTWELEEYIDNAVIVIPNEWSNPIVGFGVRIVYLTQNQDPFLVVKDYVQNQEFYVFGKIFHYTHERFEAMMALNPSERYSLMSNSKEPVTLVDQSDEVFTEEDLRSILKNNGFYERLEEPENDYVDINDFISVPCGASEAHI